MSGKVGSKGEIFMKHKIAVISDTHSLLRPEITKEIKECELILHAGDIASEETVENISNLGESYFVRGNADKGSWASDIPVTREVELFGLKLFMIHNRKQMQEPVPDYDIVVYGHSHKYAEEYKNGVCYFNPGSCGPRRFHQEVTMAILTVDDETKQFAFEKIDCSPILKADSAALPPKDMAALIGRITSQMDAGKTVEEIAKKNRVAENLVRQILQIYTTHPGVDVDGILNRMEIWNR
jgi:putative phosphoesterase